MTKPKQDDPVPGTNGLTARKPKPDPADQAAMRTPAGVSWPKAGAAEVELAAAKPGQRLRAPGMPVSVIAGEQSPAKIHLELADPTAAKSAGVDSGLLLKARPTTGRSSTKATIEVDTAAFRNAYGGDYASRLVITRLPDCAATSPHKPGCLPGEPLPTQRDLKTGQISAELTFPAAEGETERASSAAPAHLLAVTAASSSSAGDFQATSMSPSSTWQVSTQSGDFSWSYPMRVPPVPGGLAPKVSLDYSSGSVDGRTAATNNQASQIGEGFEYSPGYIERRYKSCKDDGQSNSADLCWGYQNATLSMNGRSGELVRDDDGAGWRLKNDDATRVEHLTGATGNGDDDTEYWKITTTDGTQYFYGKHRLPGWADGKAVTDSTWTVPVFGDDAGEPCHESTFASSWCQQAWRWNLDLVIDPRGNAVSYWYERETNHYGRNLNPSAGTAYHRGGYLTRSDYGQRRDNLYATAPAQVAFSNLERCLPSGSITCAPSELNSSTASHWPDVPFDQNCNAGAECTNRLAPTFWSRKRVAKITTQVWDTATSKYRPVVAWALNHTFPPPGDGTAPALWLNEITHTGHVGGTATTPSVTFSGLPLDNRVDALEGLAPLKRYRIAAVHTETGGQIDVDYLPKECTRAATPAPASNTKRCFPTYWTPEGEEELLDWFHKYPVSSVDQLDLVAGSQDVMTRYEYLDGAAWHFDDDDALVPEKRKTWSQWRGYGRVRVHTGGDGEQQELNEYRYFRGMHGDRTATGGGKTVSVTDSTGGTYTDSNQFSGRLREEIIYNGPGGAVVSKTIKDPWSKATASRARSWGTATAYLTGEAKTRTITPLAAGGERETVVTNTFDDYGMVTETSDFGDNTTAADNECTRTTYARNTDAWLISHSIRTEKVRVACDATVSRPDDVISDSRTSYDNQPYGTAPTKGDATLLEELASYSGTSPQYKTDSRAVYDGYGRQTSVTDAAGNTTTTAFTPSTGAPTQVLSTNPAGHTSTRTFEPAWGLPLTTVDANNKRTDAVYDPLGRLVKVWLPNRSKTGGDTPNLEYAYQVSKTAPSHTTTKTLRNNLGYNVSYTLVDGLARPRQTQSPAPGGGRVITETFHDTRGNIVKTRDAYFNSDAPSSTLFVQPNDDQIPRHTETIIDGAGREAAVKHVARGNEKWRTTTSYGGDRTTVDPPTGGTPTTTIVDARGRTTELREYLTGSPTGDYRATTYTYEKHGEIATVTDPAGNVWRNTYDLTGRLITADDPDKGTTTTTYDSLDRPVTVTDARGKTSVSVYDKLGRVTAIHAGSATGAKLAEWTYDTQLKGHLTSATSYIDGQAYTKTQSGFDAMSRPQRTTYSIPASEGFTPSVFSYTTLYNLDGTVQTTSIPAAGGLPTEGLAYGYDELGNPATLTTGSVANTTIGAIYSKTNQLLQLRMKSGSNAQTQTTYSYDENTNRLSNLLLEREGVTGYDTNTTYGYDDAGNITRIADTAAGRTPDVQCFTYDGLRQLTEAWTTPNSAADSCQAGASASTVGGPYAYWQSFTYDEARNRTSETQHGIAGAADVTRTYNYPDPGQPRPHAVQTVVGGTNSLGLQYDAAGNTVTRTEGAKSQTSEYDHRGHLAKVTDQAGKITSFAYDADGNRLIRREPGATTLYLPGMELRKDAASGTITATRYYSHAGRTVATQAADKTLHWLAGDHNGTAMTAINAVTGERSRRYYTPFGTQRGAEGTFPGERGYIGGTNDSTTGLVHLGAREYDPSTGRFTTVDPLLDLTRPAMLNGYAYADNSPITYSDPDGQKPHCGMGCEWTSEGTVYRHGGHKPAKNVPDPRIIRQYGGGGGSSGGSGKSAAQLAYERNLQHARIAAAEAKHKVESAAKALVQIAADELGITDALDCFTKGDLGACGSTLLNVGTSLIGGLAGKLLAKYGAPWQWKKGLALVERIKTLGGQLIGGLRDMWRTNRRVRQLEKSAPSCATNSFTPGTKVLMTDGKRKPIEKVRVGDRVLATDPITGKTSAEIVTAEIKGTGVKHLVQLTIDIDGKKGDKSATITSTDGHPFWTPKHKAWVDAAHLKTGNWLQTSTGTWVQITATKRWTAQHATVHNLTVTTHHTYYVQAGATDALAHNCGDSSADDYWPPNRGFHGAHRVTVLKPGALIDRFGEERGRFVSPSGTPIAERALAPGTTDAPYHVYEVTNRLVVQTGRVEPWFGQPGMGVQHYLPASVKDLLEAGYLREVG